MRLELACQHQNSRHVIWLQRCIALGFGLLLGLQLSGCSGVFFVPARELVRAPSDLGLDYEEVWVDAADSIKLHGWYLPSTETSRGTVVFLHGNAQNISYHIASVAWLVKRGFNVYLYDYRGFGLSTGRSTPQNAIDDFSAVIDTVTQRWLDSQKGVVVFGQSLGAALAIAAVHQAKDNYPIKGLVLDSAFSDFRGIAKEKLEALRTPRAISRLLTLSIPAKPDLTRMIGELSPLPILLFHGGQDSIVPAAHTIRLFEAAGSTANLWIEPDAGHIASLRNPALRDYFVEFLDKAFAAKVTTDRWMATTHRFSQYTALQGPESPLLYHLP